MAAGSPTRNASVVGGDGVAVHARGGGVNPRGPAGTSPVPPVGRGVLPNAGTLDYLNKLTSTTFLLIGGAVFLLVFARSPRRAIGRVSDRIAGVKP
jgi:hypothetical protein